MRIINASSPTKAIIAGEHSVVYGGLAIAAPLNNRKKCECTIEKVEAGKGVIIARDIVGSGKYFANGNYEDEDGWFRAKARAIEHILKTEKRGIEDLRIGMSFSRNAIPKGTGHSAATAAALSLCIYSTLGIAPGMQKLFDAVQAFEEIAHAGRPSGIDAQTVLSDFALRFRKNFGKGGDARFEFEKVQLELPDGTSLLVVNTLKKGENADATGALLEKFAKNAGFGKRPPELSQEERVTITERFDVIVEKIGSELKREGDAEKLGALLLKNHGLLREFGMSSDGIEEAIKIALEKGALGAKITGAGGRGGAILALCRKKDAGKILRAMKELGMGGARAEFSRNGAMIEGAAK